MAENASRRVHPDNLDGDVSTSGGQVTGPGLPQFDSNVSTSGSAMADYSARKASTAKGGKSLQTENGTASPGKVRLPQTGAARKVG